MENHPNCYSLHFSEGYTYTTNQIPSGFSNVQHGEDPPKLDELLDFPTIEPPWTNVSPAKVRLPDAEQRIQRDPQLLWRAKAKKSCEPLTLLLGKHGFNVS